MDRQYWITFIIIEIVFILCGIVTWLLGYYTLTKILIEFFFGIIGLVVIAWLDQA